MTDRLLNRKRTMARLSGAPALLPYTEVIGADGVLPSSWDYTAGKWTVVDGKIIGAPGLGVDVITNGGFDTDTDWTKGAGWSIAEGVATRAAGGDSGISQPALTSGTWYKASLTASDIAVYYHILFGTRYGGVNSQIVTDLAIGVNAGLYAYGAVGALDNVVFKSITLADMFSSRNFGATDIDISVPLTVTTYQQCGLVVCLDNWTSPANFVIAGHDGVRASLRKCVNGSYTTLVEADATYGAGRVLRVVKAGNNISVYYHGIQIGTTQVVNDASILNAARHGRFTTSPASAFGALQAVAV